MDVSSVPAARRVYQLSPLRQRLARQTRLAILTAARELFLAQGYGATTIDQIAERAGVSKPTVFTAVGNKQALLKVVRDVAIAGDDEPLGVAERPTFQAVLAEPDAYHAVALMVDQLADLWARYAEIKEVFRGATSSGEPELRQLWETSERERLVGARAFITTLTEKSPLRAGLDAESATDLMWCLMAPENYLALVIQRGWPVEKYKAWLTDTLTTTLLPPRLPRRRRRVHHVV